MGSRHGDGAAEGPQKGVPRSWSPTCSAWCHAFVPFSFSRVPCTQGGLSAPMRTDAGHHAGPLGTMLDGACMGAKLDGACMGAVLGPRRGGIGVDSVATCTSTGVAKCRFVTRAMPGVHSHAGPYAGPHAGPERCQYTTERCQAYTSLLLRVLVLLLHILIVGQLPLCPTPRSATTGEHVIYMGPHMQVGYNRGE